MLRTRSKCALATDYAHIRNSTCFYRHTVHSNAALVYFNECCGKFDWHFGPFKMQVVLFPGGIEFMKIMVQLSMIAMRATLKRNEPTGYK